MGLVGLSRDQRAFQELESVFHLILSLLCQLLRVFFLLSGTLAHFDTVCISEKCDLRILAVHVICLRSEADVQTLIEHSWP